MIPDSLFYQNTRIVDVGEAGMLPGAIQSTRNAAFLERLWHALPNERDRLRPYIEKAKAYRNECGCVTGGVFFVGALVLLILDGLFSHQITNGSWVGATLRGVAVAFVASLLGKAIGIGIARLRLVLTYRELRIRYPMNGD
jgi:VIT1/CCC1 family predicted Fe2+/Mn2+ transporter